MAVNFQIQCHIVKPDALREIHSLWKQLFSNCFQLFKFYKFSNKIIYGHLRNLFFIVCVFLFLFFQNFWSEFRFLFSKTKCWVINSLCVWWLWNSISFFSITLGWRLKFLFDFVFIKLFCFPKGFVGELKRLFVFIFVLPITQNYTFRSAILLP